jgi:heavy metal translocating P-type ATPase
VEEIPVKQLRQGDILQVKPGARVPADGTVIEGGASMDESMLTGESIPVFRGVGDKVTTATVNTDSFFRMRVDAVGADTSFSRILRMVEEAGASKPPISRLADRIAGIFVPVVMGLALLTAAVWLILGREFSWALTRAVAVLVVSCPCALGLATPVAIMVGTGQAAKNGLLFKSAAAMEQLSSVDTVVFDKTGTLTEGLPAVTDLIVLNGEDETALLAAAAALEAKSEHPIAAAVLRRAEGLPLPEPTDFQSFAGEGVAGTVDGSRYHIGNRRLMAEAGVEIDTQSETLQTLADAGKTPLLLAKNGALAAVLAVADTEKPHAAAVIAALRAHGIESCMLTGDNARTANAVASRLGIDRVEAEVLPENKDSVVRALQQSGKTVAMVGDGINDAPALARADVGVAIGNGTDVAVESADLVLLNKDIFAVKTAVRLSKAVIRNIRMNLFWAFFYNVIAIPLAAGAFYGILGLRLTPMVGAAAMSVSSLTVVLNALRLRRFRAETPPPDTDKTTENEEEEPEMKQIIEVTGMHCGHCAAAVEEALAALPGVKKAKADHEQNRAVISVAAAVPADAIKAAVEGAGFTCGAIETKKGLFS